MSKQPVETLAGHIGKLTLKEQLIICGIVRSHCSDQKYQHLHPGLLPFTPIIVVSKSLRHAQVTKPVAVIISKINLMFDSRLSERYMNLNLSKVHKLFGANLSKGLTLNWLPVKYRKGLPVSRTIKLRYVPPNRSFIVTIEPEYNMAVVYWLIDNCT